MNLSLCSGWKLSQGNEKVLLTEPSRDLTNLQEPPVLLQHSSAFPTFSGVSFTSVPTLCLSPGQQSLRAQQKHWCKPLLPEGQKPAGATAAFPHHSSETTHWAARGVPAPHPAPPLSSTPPMLPPSQDLRASPAPWQQDRVSTLFRRRWPALAVKTTGLILTSEKQLVYQQTGEAFLKWVSWLVLTEKRKGNTPSL